MQKLYPDAMLERLEWRRDLRNLMGRLSADYSVREEGQAFDRYWSSREDVCLGVNEGWYVGPEAVAGYYKALDEEIVLAAKCVQQDYPDKLGDKTEEEIRGVGAMSYIPFDSQVIEIADDGQTAKGLFNIRGSYSKVTVAGPVAYWLFGWAAVDFVLEDGEWKILNLLLVYNVDHVCGTNFTEPDAEFEPVEGFAAMADFKLPAPNVPMTVMETFYPDRQVNRSPRVPEPYGTFTETFSYGI